MNTLRIKPLSLSLLLAGVAVPLFVLNGCDGGGGSASLGSGASAASLSVGATFPAGAAKALVDSNTDVLVVKIFQGEKIQSSQYYCDYDVDSEMCPDPDQMLTLTPASPNGEANGLVAGPVKVVIIQKDTKGTESTEDDEVLDKLVVPGELAVGANSFIAPLVRGKWTLASAINLNKTLANSGERLDSFAMMQVTGTAGTTKADIWYQSPNYYQILVKGTNLPGDCDWVYDEEVQYERLVCATNNNASFLGYLQYLIGFSGKDTAKNRRGFETYYDEGLPLKSDGDRRRFAFFNENIQNVDYYGTDESSYVETNTFSHNGQNVTAEIDALASVRPTDAGTSITGAMIEIEVISESQSRSCYTDEARTQPYGGTGACPWEQAQAAKASQGTRLSRGMKQGFAQAIQTRQSQAGKAAADANGCYLGLVNNWTDDWKTSWWDSGTSTSIPIYVRESGTGTYDACLHSLNATGATLTATDVDEIKQAAGLDVGVTKAASR